MTILRKIQSNCFILLTVCLMTAGFVMPQISLAQTDGNFPKIANYYIAWEVGDKEIEELAKWDLVILSPQALAANPQAVTKLKQKNPNIKVLVYVLIQEISTDSNIYNSVDFYQKIYQAVSQNNWWLKTPDGQNVYWWPGTNLINATSVAPKANGQSWNDFLAPLVNDQYLKNNLVDGIFYDNAWSQVSWVIKARNYSGFDVNADGAADSEVFVDQKWQEGLKNILSQTKSLAPDKIVIINTNDNFYNSLINGRMRESFPATSEGNWTNNMRNYLSADFGYEPELYVINGTTSNTGNNSDYQTFRFGLASTLLGNGYYSFDFGDMGHNFTWWYDEYDVFLGKPVTDKKNLLNQSTTEVQPSVWQRDFQNGIVLVNSTGTEQKVAFTSEYEKIKGTQDKATNNGAIVKNVNLKAEDGLILLRRVEDVLSNVYINGSFVRPYNKRGEAVRNGFFLYDKNYKGNQALEKKDINKDGQQEIIVADNSKITIYDGNQKVITTFYPYGDKYNKGINFSINDFENDGYFEIITGAGRGYAPLVKVFNYKGEAQGDGFYAYAKGYLGGVNVAVCTTKGNGNKEIVTGAGYMGGPQVRIFDKNGKVLSGGFFAYGTTFRGGVNVACGDIDANGIDEIVTGAGFGGSSHVRMFNSKFEALNPGFFAFGKDTRTGVRVFLADLDNDGAKEILAASPDVFTTAINK
ncbi:MAG: putative glycoside hydrolase [Candidatus Parcubacteria bacterium]|nr:putative glycoside hydrolase [Candidatus Parcubacteria bacterium]